MRWLDRNHRTRCSPRDETWGTPWPRGKQQEAKNFALRGSDQKLQPLQSWPLRLLARRFAGVDPRTRCRRVKRSHPDRSRSLRDRPPQTLSVSSEREGNRQRGENQHRTVRMPHAPRQLDVINLHLAPGGREALRDGKLVLLRRKGFTLDLPRRHAGCRRKRTFRKRAREGDGRTARTGARGSGSLKVNTRMAARQWLQFTLRLYFYAGSRQPARAPHHRVRWRRVQGFHPRIREANRSRT